ncbi:hypothetical protein GUJ93_ZPchr0013g33834 [Zizania palustris]|uniref:Uncharacterized protein n=1 Tax=Zizania palustris TaxID=103762 RepID=A0A8J6C1V9_ZIZPA|nr:hypothetical protein GUJ93_ZPchr0013g33834 [Zizania palustris]
MRLSVVAVALLLPLAAAVLASAEQFDFFYLVQQQGCCFPDSGKPAAEFGIHGLWPNYAQCRSSAGEVGLVDMGVMRRKKCWPEYCDDGKPLSLWEIKDLVKQLDQSWPTLSCKSGKSMEFWSYEWRKHGTCSDLGQHDYFAAALALKSRHNLTAILADAGIVPSDDDTYFLSSISDAIAEGTGFKANLECNRDKSGETQLFQVYQCVDRSGNSLIDCPLPMQGKCRDRVKLPPFVGDRELAVADTSAARAAG